MAIGGEMNRRELLIGSTSFATGTLSTFDPNVILTNEDSLLHEKIEQLQRIGNPIKQLRVLKDVRDLLHKRYLEISDQLPVFRHILELLHPYLQATLSFRQFITKNTPNRKIKYKSGLEYFYISEKNLKLLPWIEFIADSMSDKAQALMIARNLKTIAPQILEYTPNQFKEMGKLALILNLIEKIKNITQKYRMMFSSQRMHSLSGLVVFAGTPNYPNIPVPEDQEHEFIRSATKVQLRKILPGVKIFKLDTPPDRFDTEMKTKFLNAISESTDDLEVVLLGHNNTSKNSPGIFISPYQSIGYQDLINSYKKKLNKKSDVTKTGLIYFHPCDKTYISDFMQSWSDDNALRKFPPPIIISECEEGTQSYTSRERSYGSEILEYFLKSKTIDDFISNEKNMKRFLLESKPCLHVPFFIEKDKRWTYLQIF